MTNPEGYKNGDLVSRALDEFTNSKIKPIGCLTILWGALGTFIAYETNDWQNGALFFAIGEVVSLIGIALSGESDQDHVDLI